MPPPVLPGLTYARTLGSGGYADVHAYEQRLPSRVVAVKVLRDALPSAAAAAAFVGEANAMARLEHPHIVTVHAAGIADDGRPYLVMAFQPGPTLSALARTGGCEVAEVLRIGVQLAGAVETAHTGGVLHRDIKPANVLTNRYGSPALADFGLSGTAIARPESGVSLPWAAPEVLFETAAASPRSDVYSLAATLWTLATGHAPHEEPGGDNRPAALLRRVRSPRLGRSCPGVPRPLTDLLWSALETRPEDRPASALEFVRRLQQVEEELGLPATTAVLPEAAPVPPATVHPRLASTLLEG